MSSSDPYSAVWVSHSSINDFLNCPRAYHLRNIYRDPKTGHKIKLVSPPLTLGQAIHEIIDSLSVLPVEKRFDVSFANRLEELWKKYEGKRGGFINTDQEHNFKTRALTIFERLTKHPGPLAKKAVKIKSDKPILYYFLSQKDNIILCGKIDWLEYIPEHNSVHIIDFKTTKNDEREDSLQLPIYYLLAKKTQKRPIDKTSYWYIERANEPVEKPLPNAEKTETHLLELAKKIQLARKLNVFKCPHGGCRFCKPYEQILKKEAEFVGTDEYNADIYFLPEHIEEDESIVL